MRSSKEFYQKNRDKQREEEETTLKKQVEMKVFQNFPKGKKRVKGTEPTSEKVLTNTTQSHNTNPLHNEAIKIVNEYVRLHGFNPKNRCFGVIDFNFKTEGKEGV